MGRPKGSPNKATARREAYYAKEGILPLDYMLKTLRDGTKTHEQRMAAARDAAPYVHPRLSTVEAKVDAKATIREIRDVIVDPSD